MKKSKINAGTAKKPVEGSTPSIHKFFKTTAKSLPADKGASKIEEDGGTQAVYIELLKAKLNGKIVLNFLIR